MAEKGKNALGSATVDRTTKNKVRMKQKFEALKEDEEGLRSYYDTNNARRRKATRFLAYAQKNKLTKEECKAKVKGGLLSYDNQLEIVVEHFTENWDNRMVLLSESNYW